MHSINPTKQARGLSGWLARLHAIEVGGPPDPAKLRIPKKHLARILRLLLMLIENGLSLPKALTTLANDRASHRWRPVLQKIRTAVESGSSLSDALRLAPRTFDEMIVQQIRIGERCGNLDKALARICEGLDRSVEVRKRIIKKISYPLLVTVAGSGLTIFMITFVVPEFESVYAGSQVELPKVTQIVTGTSRLVIKWGPLAIVGLIGSLWGLQRWRNRANSGIGIDRALLKIPLIGSWLRDAAVLQFSEALLTMVDSGYTPADAVKAAVPCVKNRAIRKTVDEVRQAVQRGERISTVLSRYDSLFPATFCQLVGVGEQSGDFGKAMQGAVKHLRESVEARVDAGLSIIEPALTIGLAGIVGSIVLSIYMPMFNMFEVLE